MRGTPVHPRLLAVPLLVLALFVRPGPVRAGEEGPAPVRALVFEHADEWTKATGAAALLERAGANVRPLLLTQSPKHAPADLIVIGSFASEDPAFREFLAARGRDLAAFVEGGGVVLELTQADQTEAAPPFLPEGLEAFRGDGDHADLHVLAAGDPLLAGLPVKGDRVALPAHRVFRQRPSWESFVWQKGFRTIVAGDAKGRTPALLEAAAGSGRVILTSMPLDKVADAEGKPVADPTWVAAGERFFAAVVAHARTVRDGTAPAVVPSPHPDAAEPAAPRGDPVAVATALGPSDTAVYERSVVTRKGDRIWRKGGKPWTVHGHDLRDGGRYLPSTPGRDDLPPILAFLLPPAGETAADVDRELPLGDTAPLRVKGNVAAFERGEGEAEVAGSFEFATRGGDEKTRRVRDGTAEVSATFDRIRGVVSRAFVRIAYEHGVPGEVPKRVETEYVFDLEAVRRPRYAEFQPDVDAAIERGVAWLAGQQKEDGTFPPHGDWLFGTTALSVYTLVSMGVPLADPRVGKSLAWMTEREPTRTYERALGLMAMERAYTPPAEAASEWRGDPVEHRRDLPPERRAWCERVADALERSAPSPGFWCYPQTNPRALLRHDTSNTQYAVLGLRAASRLGIEVKEATWLGVLRYFEQVRGEKGPRGSILLVPEGRGARGGESVAATPYRARAGFRYATIEPMDAIRGSMTAAGIASLAIAGDELRRAKSRKFGPREERDLAELTNGAWARLDSDWAVDRHPGLRGNGWYYYWLYSLERAGILSGVKLVGGKDWYFEGAVEILVRQKKNGAWSEPGGNDVPETCFALLFLKRATPPTSSGR